MNNFYNDPLLKVTYVELQKISLDPKNRHLYDQKEKWIMLELTKKHEMEEEKLLKFQEGKAEGKVEAKINTLINILKLKFKEFSYENELKIKNISNEEILDQAILLSVTSQNLESILKLLK